ncbi:MAG: glycosyltransferase [Chloroflexi bacterium]|nr:glycosyltransferase [Chloroflexota bacterium]
MTESRSPRVCVIGPGTRFLGGISYYTIHLVNALAQSYKMSVILMRRLLPTRLYPGWKRVGANLTQLKFEEGIRVFDGIDWYWFPSMMCALLRLVRERPQVVVFQWWSGTVLHSYLLLIVVARLLIKAKVVIEFHEVLDTAEAKLAPVRSYVRLVAPLAVNQAHGFVIHSQYDRQLLQEHYDLRGRPVALIPHGPYNHYVGDEPARREAPLSCCNLLFFGLIRPYKGLDDLIKAFDALSEDESSRYWLTIVGETWEGWTAPAELIAQSRYRNRITFVNRYVSDAEVAQFFAGADALILPYRRSSASGPLHIAMSCGLPIVATRVGGLVEALNGYGGAILVPPGDAAALRSALLQVANLCGRRYADTHSWQHTISGYRTLFDAIEGLPAVRRAQRPLRIH